MNRGHAVFDDGLDKENAIRKKILKEWVTARSVLTIYRYNRRRDDFTELKEYNDYLEEVEDISTLTIYYLNFFSL
jgi:hypothetical protein